MIPKCKNCERRFSHRFLSTFDLYSLLNSIYFLPFSDRCRTYRTHVYTYELLSTRLVYPAIFALWVQCLSHSTILFTISFPIHLIPIHETLRNCTLRSIVLSLINLLLLIYFTLFFFCYFVLSIFLLIDHLLYYSGFIRRTSGFITFLFFFIFFILLLLYYYY